MDWHIILNYILGALFFSALYFLVRYKSDAEKYELLWRKRHEYITHLEEELERARARRS